MAGPGRGPPAPSRDEMGHLRTLADAGAVRLRPRPVRPPRLPVPARPPPGVFFERCSRASTSGTRAGARPTRTPPRPSRRSGTPTQRTCYARYLRDPQVEGLGFGVADFLGDAAKPHECDPCMKPGCIDGLPEWEETWVLESTPGHECWGCGRTVQAAHRVWVCGPEECSVAAPDALRVLPRASGTGRAGGGRPDAVQPARHRRAG